MCMSSKFGTIRRLKKQRGIMIWNGKKINNMVKWTKNKTFFKSVQFISDSCGRKPFLCCCFHSHETNDLLFLPVVFLHQLQLALSYTVYIGKSTQYFLMFEATKKRSAQACSSVARFHSRKLNTLDFLILKNKSF